MPSLDFELQPTNITDQNQEASRCNQPIKLQESSPIKIEEHLQEGKDFELQPANKIQEASLNDPDRKASTRRRLRAIISR